LLLIDFSYLVFCSFLVIVVAVCQPQHHHHLQKMMMTFNVRSKTSQ